jgi:hypothetical protein
MTQPQANNCSSVRWHRQLAAFVAVARVTGSTSIDLYSLFTATETAEVQK